MYLPLLWEPSFCCRSPIALGYTRGHFSALVAPEPASASASSVGGAASASAASAASAAEAGRAAYLPLVTAEDQVRFCLLSKISFAPPTSEVAASARVPFLIFFSRNWLACG